MCAIHAKPTEGMLYFICYIATNLIGAYREAKLIVVSIYYTNFIGIINVISLKNLCSNMFVEPPLI